MAFPVEFRPTFSHPSRIHGTLFVNLFKRKIIMNHLLTLYYYFCPSFHGVDLFFFFLSLFGGFSLFVFICFDYLKPVVLDWCACVVGVAVAIASLRYAAA